MISSFVMEITRSFVTFCREFRSVMVRLSWYRPGSLTFKSKDRYCFSSRSAPLYLYDAAIMSISSDIPKNLNTFSTVDSSSLYLFILYSTVKSVIPGDIIKRLYIS